MTEEIKEEKTQEEKQNDERIKQKMSVFFGVCGLIGSISLLPPIFNRYFAVAPLLENEVSGLWKFFVVICGISLYLILFKKRAKSGFILLFFSVLLLIGVEQFVRLYNHYFADEEKTEKMAKSSYATYPELMAYQGHPFLAFTGMPSVALKGNDALGGLKAFNNYGFLGGDFEVEKPKGTIRIATLGGSTTASGYPSHMETFLNEQSKVDSVQYQVYNFGVTYWTTAHSAVNFILNVQDFDPDYIVIHHAWNEEKVRNTKPEDFRGDYSHAFKYWHEPEIPDRLPMRMSLTYRLLQENYGSVPAWQMLEPATTIDREKEQPPFENKEELKPFERNIKTILDLAELRGIKVVLTTQPHSTDPNIPAYYGHPAIDQGNEVMRRIREEYQDRTLYVDLDSIMTGHMNDMFKDLGHMIPKGVKFKGHQIGEVILNDAEMIKMPVDTLVVDTIQ